MHHHQLLCAALGIIFAAPLAARSESQNAVPVSLYAQNSPTLDTPENLQNVLSQARRTFKRGGNPTYACEPPIVSLATAGSTVINEGWRSLQSKCEAALRAEAQAATATEDHERARDREAAIADLKSGRRQPAGCIEFMVAQGATTSTAPITEVGLQPPQGLGAFTAEIGSIEGKTLFLRQRLPAGIRGDGRDGRHLVLTTDANTKIFSVEGLRIGSLIDVYGYQTSTRRLPLTSGATVVAPVIGASCVEPFSFENTYGR